MHKAPCKYTIEKETFSEIWVPGSGLSKGDMEDVYGKCLIHCVVLWILIFFFAFRVHFLSYPVLMGENLK